MPPTDKPSGSTPGVLGRLRSNRHLRAILEMVVFVFALAVLNNLLFPLDPVYRSMRPHPYLIGVALTASFYGLPAGVLTALVAAGALIGQLAGQPGQSLDRVLSDPLVQQHIAWFFGTGYILGIIRRVHADHVDETNRRLAEVKRRATTLREQTDALRGAKTELEQRIIGQTASVHSLYASIKGLESLDRAELHEALVRLAVVFTGATRCALWLVEGDSERLRLAHVHGRPMPESAPVLTGDMTAVGTSLRVRRVVTANDLQLLGQSQAASAAKPEEGSLLAAPLIVGGKPYGVLSIEEIPFERLSLSTVRILGMLSDLAGTAIDNALAHEQVSEERPVDPATTLFRHAYARRRLADECARSGRYRLATSMLFLMPHDGNGETPEYPAAVLRQIGQAVRQCTRTVDLVAKGEEGAEMLVVLPLTDLSGALITAERIRTCLDAVQPGWPAHWLIGVAARHEKEPADTLYQRLRRAVARATGSPNHDTVVVAD